MKNKGFTIIELLVVIVIIGILSTVTIPVFSSQLTKARDSKRQSAVKTIATVVKVNQVFLDKPDYRFVNKVALSIELEKQYYTIPKGADNNLCYVYGYKNTSLDEFFIAVGMEQTGGPTITVLGTPNGVSTAHSLSAAIGGNTTGNCTNNTAKISQLSGMENTYSYVIF